MIRTASRNSRVQGIDLADYLRRDLTSIPVAIPSFRRDRELCEQTLTTLKDHGWDLQHVYVFMDPNNRRPNHEYEFDAYWRRLAQQGYQDVKVLPGAARLTGQYNRIF